jgi:hypothetical protein
LSCCDFQRQAQALSDQVGNHFDELRTFLKKAVVRLAGLYRENSLQVSADPDRHGNERQFALVDAEPVEKARLVGNPPEHHRARLLEHQSEDPFARLVLHVLHVANAGRMVQLVCLQVA